MENNIDGSTVVNSIIPLEPGSSNNTGSIGVLMNGIFNYYDLNAVSLHKAQALLTTFGSIAPHLNENITLILSEHQGVNGLSLLNTILKIIPDNFTTEFSDLNKQFLIFNPEALKSKAVVAHSSSALKKNSSLLRNLVVRCNVKDHDLRKTSGVRSINEINIDGAISIIVLVGKKAPPWLNEFSALRLNLDSNPNFVIEQLNMRRSRPDPRRILIHQKVVKKEIGRLKPQPVNIYFEDQIIDSLDTTNYESIAIIDTICSLLKIICIINKAVFASRDEAGAGFYEIDMSIIKDPQLLIEQKGNHEPGRIEPLEATKVDYYILYVIVEGVFNFNEDQLTGNLRLIFDAIKAINGGYIFNSTTLEVEIATEVEFIKALDNQVDGRGWASILQIKEKIKKDKNIEMSDHSIHRGVKELCKRKFVTERKDPKMSKKYLYGISTFFLDSDFALPKPSTIFDPVYKGEKVDVTNPLTGKKEVI